MMHLLAQITSDALIDAVTKIGWPGVVLLVVLRGMERLDRSMETNSQRQERGMEQLSHTIKGLSMALWVELASRPHTDPNMKQTAQREIAKIEAAQQAKGPPP